MKKKGLAIIYDPHNLYQFVWYYCNKGKKREWDALCLPNGHKGEYMHTFCEKAGIFSQIYKDNTDYSKLSLLNKLKLIVLMFGHFLVNKQKRMCKKILSQYIDVDNYDEFVVIADVGVVSGACVVLGEEKEVIILEDGINDYGERPKWISKGKMKSSYNWQGLLMARMGYCSPGWFRLDADKYCIKYSSQPDKMIYQEYREIRQLYEKENTDNKLFDQVIRRIYPAISNIDFSEVDAILLTRPLDDYVENEQKYIKKLEKYISEHYQNVLIKKHPREKTEYCFERNVKCMEIDNSIPAEVLLPYLKGKDIIIVTISAIMLYMKAYELKCKVVEFKGLYEESVASDTQFRPLDEKEINDFCKKFIQENCKIIML